MAVFGRNDVRLPTSSGLTAYLNNPDGVNNVDMTKYYYQKMRNKSLGGNPACLICRTGIWFWTIYVSDDFSPCVLRDRRLDSLLGEIFPDLLQLVAGSYCDK